MKYEIELKKTAAKQLKKLSPALQNRITYKITLLATNPFLAGSAQLAGRPYRKVRVGTYRIIYEVRQGELVIIVIRIAHRKEAYKNL